MQFVFQNALSPVDGGLSGDKIIGCGAFIILGWAQIRLSVLGGSGFVSGAPIGDTRISMEILRWATIDSIRFLALLSLTIRLLFSLPCSKEFVRSVSFVLFLKISSSALSKAPYKNSDRVNFFIIVP